MTILSLELTKEDFYRFSYYTNWSASWNFKKRLIYHIKNIVYGGALGLLFFYLLNQKITLAAIVGASIFVLLFNFIILPVWIRNDYRKYAEKFYANPSNSSFFLKTELVINEKGILNKDDVSTTMHSWPAFVKKSETDVYYYLYLNSQLALVIPKRIFASQKEKSEFESMLLAYFPLQAELNSLKR